MPFTMVVVAASVHPPLSATDREWCRHEGILSRCSEEPSGCGRFQRGGRRERVSTDRESTDQVSTAK